MKSKKRQPKKAPVAPEPEKAGGHGVLAGRPEWWGKFILALMQTRSMAAAAQAANTTRQNAAQVIAHNPELAQEVAEAQELRAGILRGYVFRIATRGILLKTYGPDRRTVTGYEHKWDGRVLLALAASELEEFKRSEDGDKGKGGGSTLTREEVLSAIAGAAEAFRAFQGVPRIAASSQPPPVRVVPPAGVDRR